MSVVHSTAPEVQRRYQWDPWVVPCTTHQLYSQVLLYNSLNMCCANVLCQASLNSLGSIPWDPNVMASGKPFQILKLPSSSVHLLTIVSIGHNYILYDPLHYYSLHTYSKPTLSNKTLCDDENTSVMSNTGASSHTGYWALAMWPTFQRSWIFCFMEFQ